MGLFKDKEKSRRERVIESMNKDTNEDDVFLVLASYPGGLRIISKGGDNLKLIGMLMVGEQHLMSMSHRLPEQIEGGNE